jgi:hypothetical protein
MHTSKFKGLQEGIPNTCDDKQPEDCKRVRRSIVSSLLVHAADACCAAQWAEAGECGRNKAFMLGLHGVDGNCIASCCLPTPKVGTLEDACNVCT